MEKIGIICEYNPFHNGHSYHINKIKELYPDSLIILVLNGYFLERGSVSIISKEDKTKIALKNNVDIVLELPALFGTQSADTFAYKSIEVLNNLGVNKIIFGSESNNIDMLYKLAKLSLDKANDKNIKEYLDKGYNYPTAMAKVLNTEFDFKPNDLLGISYIKATLEINKNIQCETIKRTNEYLDTKSNDEIISADNIRNKISNNEDISKYLPSESISYINNINYDLMYKLLKISIMNNEELNQILDVDEGIENRLYKVINKSNNLNEFIEEVKSKRYTYNRINRMIIHILLGIKKSDAKENINTKILGFNSNGKKYLNTLKTKFIVDKNSTSYKYEIKASILYDLLTNNNSYNYELSTKPIIYK